MSITPGMAGEYVKAMDEAHKMKLRRQMHHDLCVLSAGGANARGLNETAQNARALYKLLWSQVMEELP